MPANASTVNILLVPEDHESTRDVFEQYSRIEGVQTHSAGTVTTALEMFRSGGFDAVVSGMRLGGNRTGLEFLNEVRRIDQIFPFFFFTFENSPSLISAAFQAGANDFFVSDGSRNQLDVVVEAVRVSAEIATLLREKMRGQKRSLFEEKYELLFDELKEGSMIISLETGEITYANESLAESTGRSPEQMIGETLDSLLAVRKGAVGGWHEMEQKAQEGATVVQLSFRHTQGHVKSFWTQMRTLELGDKPVLLCQCRDVTRLEQLEQEISSVRNQLKVIVENSADAIILTREDGLIEFIGGAAPRMFGVSAEDSSISTIDDLFGVQAVQIHRVIHQMGQRSRVSGLESQIVSRWGTHVPVTVAITRLPSSDKITRYLFNIMDITPQKVIEAEKLMITELVGIMGTGVGPAEALPKLIERLSTKVPIEYGLVARLNNEGEMLDVVAVYSALEKSSIQIGQELKSEYLPAEEELWMREGIVRNNLQPYGLHPLETLLFQEGVRSYLSLPLIDRGRLIGGAHFGSSKAYALNRGHLSLFREIASALTGALVRDLQGDVTSRYRRFNSVLAERLSDPALLCDSDGRIFQVNEAARRFLGEGSELSGRLAKVVLGTQFPGVAGKGELLTRASEEPLPLTDARGIEWTLSVHRVGEQRAPQGYLLILAKA